MEDKEISSPLRNRDLNEIFFLNPSLKNTMLTSDGDLADTAICNDFGVWDLYTGKCKTILHDFISNPSAIIFALPFNRIFCYEDRKIKILQVSN
jgi:hypothetical protein